MRFLILHFLTFILINHSDAILKEVTNSPDKWSCAIGWNCDTPINIYLLRVEIRPRVTYAKWTLIRDQPTHKGGLTVDDQKKVLTPVSPRNHVGFVGRITGKNKIYETVINLYDKVVRVEPPGENVTGYTVEISKNRRVKLSAFLKTLEQPNKFYLKIDSLDGDFKGMQARVKAYYDK
uniref:CSON001402 protein n=1 Tax=Culicoides sonorensis TaxID=179676 RepID=A0A336MHR1_CULSO